MSEPLVSVVDELHDRLRLPYREVARIVGANESTLHRWRDGSTQPSLPFARTLKSLNRCLSVMAGRFQDWDEANIWLRTSGPDEPSPLDRLYDGELDLLLLELHDRNT